MKNKPAFLPKENKTGNSVNWGFIQKDDNKMIKIAEKNESNYPQQKQVNGTYLYE